jgi:tetratricopeptide (TPR) repeat protein
MSPFEEALTKYESALDHAGTNPDDLYETLVSRDKLEQVIRNSISVQELHRLLALDEKLKNIVGGKKAAHWEFLGLWRETIRPDTKLWWWRLDEHAAKVHARYGTWTLLTSVFIALSIAFATDTFNTLKATGTSMLFIFTAFFQTIVTLASGSALTEQGRKWLMGLIGLSETTSRHVGTLLAFLALCISLVVWSFLPGVMGRHYEKVARATTGPGDVSKAITNYEYAAKLDPRNFQVHFDLAKKYDLTNQRDKAIREYEQCIRLDNKNFDAYNNLSRLYNLRKDYAMALTMLRSNITNSPEADPLLTVFAKDKQYFLHLYRGWANAGLKNYQQAERGLRFATRLRENGASAHYLLGTVYGAKGDNSKEIDEYRLFIKCLEDQPGQREEVEEEWIASAQEALKRIPAGD